MMMNNLAPLERLNSKQIPVLPPGAPALLTSLTDPSIDFMQMAEIIGRYPSIAARLISLANSAWSAPVSEITSLEMACARLGFDIVRSTSIALAVAAPFDPNRCPAFAADYYWTSALLAADGSSWLTPYCTSIGIESPTARAAGLLHNLGLLWLADQLPREVQQAIELSREHETTYLREALREIIGVDYCEAGRRLGEAWKLPEVLVNAMAHHADDDFQERMGGIASLVGLASSMVSALQRETDWSPPDSRLNTLGINAANAEKVLQRLAGQLVKTQELAKTLFS